MKSEVIERARPARALRVNSNEVLVIRIGNRFFCGFGKAGRVLTAWSLAGAKLFVHPIDTESVMVTLIDKGKKPQLLALTAEVAEL
ncbi:hypothetical protein [Photobacterium halotolerans]|uniref:Uncharacterized protein n=1 Tax=Photobacterium halotolerans TaxID=265726 RepID=A0A7X5ARP8_9GAMM|nr:hypothetical protein [Photobacterium halotolerans]NAW64533.1 hypothetical protein [Photobacterium halotolerans]